MDFLALEDLLIKHLAATLTFNGKPVDVLAVREVEVDSEREPVLRVPAILVSYEGYTVAENGSNKARVEQRWTVVTAVANLRDRARREAREDGAVLLDQVMEALIGWVPPSAYTVYRALRLADPSSPVGYGRRNTYLPLTFQTARSLEGKRVNPGATP